jgi:hypothetical protein
MNNKKLESVLQASFSGDTCSTIQDLTLVEVNQMLLDLELYQTALELRLWKAGTRARRKRLTRPLIKIAQAISILSCQRKQLSSQ